jgi:hypothetical protein
MLTWSSTNASSCTASGTWSGSKAISGTQSTGTLTNTSVFSLTCTGSGGAVLQSAIVAVAGSSPSFTTNFDGTESPISEGGAWHRANNTIWTDVDKANGIAFGTNGPRNTYDDSYALLSGFGPDQTAVAVIARASGLNTIVDHEVELLLRFSDSATTAQGYECLVNFFGGVQIVKWDGLLGVFEVLTLTGGSGSVGRDIVSGDVFKATIVGNTISAYVNNVLIAQTTDNTNPYTTGQPGIGFFTRPLGNSANFGMTSYSVTSN